MARFSLPDAPPDQRGAVKAWMQPVVIPTYRPLPPDRNPMFLEKRVYQGSSGRVYPLPFTDRIADKPVDQEWQAVHIENDYLRLMILPQIGGRIHVGLDKSNGYDFFYRQSVIKPALVGLAGPWISGGVEFNWPQHHRPSTFMPVDVRIEEHADGSKTIWCGEHEPMNRMKGMHGVCLHPGRAIIELKVRLYNRTELVQTFLWWANVAARVHERYQSFFPPDVHYVADHAKRATVVFPLCAGRYYGVNYGARGREDVPPSEMPRHFVPPAGMYKPNDLSWYANIPVPTSYMAMGSKEDFFGGYDHAAEAGLVHVASHHISPGKKQWTWGNHDFGYAWDRNLTDEDGPYIELMAGVYTDNQPDFSFLHPGETRTFSQYWYPIQKIGPAQKANTDAALSLNVIGGQARIGVAVSSPLADARVSLTCGSELILERCVDLAPQNPLTCAAALPPDAKDTDVRLALESADGKLVIDYVPQAKPQTEVPPPASDPGLPETIRSNDELYLTGLHLEQYRHATRQPDIYWREALRRDAGDSRCNNAMGLWHLRRGEFDKAEQFFRAAIATQTRRNPHPYDGEPYHNLGLALRYLGRDAEAYDALYKATWNYAWQSPAFYALAELDCRYEHWKKALEHLDRALRVNVEHLQARDLKAIVLRKLDRAAEADSFLKETIQLDPLDFWARHLAGEELTCDTQVRLDLALDYARPGLFDEAIAVLDGAESAAGLGATPLVHDYRAFFHLRAGDADAARTCQEQARLASPDYCFPARLEEIAILRAAIDANPADARARYYLGNLFYDRRRYDEAIELWEQSVRIASSSSIVWRNLGIACFNIRHDSAKARAAYESALRANPGDARLLYERDQLWKRLGESPQRRLAELEHHPELVRQRDDLSLELCELYNQTGRPEQALEILRQRTFQPWEGGEGKALAQHVRTHLRLGQRAMKQSNPADAKRLFESALDCHHNLGESRHLLANCADIHYWIGVACRALDLNDAARNHFEIAARARGDFQEMSVRDFSEMTYYSAMALRALGRDGEGVELLNDLLAWARDLETKPAAIDYFATSLPSMLLFDDDLEMRQRTAARFMRAQAHVALGHNDQAREMLKEVLADDPNHAMAADLLNETTGGHA